MYIGLSAARVLKRTCQFSLVVSRRRAYRAPELLLGAKRYDAGVDMWSVGIIFVELFLRRVFLPGDSDLGQLTLIFDNIGRPTPDNKPVR